MASSYPKGYIIENSHEFQGINLFKAHNINHPSEFIKICLVAGFNIAAIKTIKDFKAMAAIALMYGFTYSSDGGIMFG